MFWSATARVKASLPAAVHIGVLVATTAATSTIVRCDTGSELPQVFLQTGLHSAWQQQHDGAHGPRSLMHGTAMLLAAAATDGSVRGSYHRQFAS